MKQKIIYAQRCIAAPSPFPVARWSTNPVQRPHSIVGDPPDIGSNTTLSTKRTSKTKTPKVFRSSGVFGKGCVGVTQCFPNVSDEGRADRVMSWAAH
jgi:hypothetical protein